ncbi:hypothetical protein HGRIS_009331 [Hohenbuehelia grisea]|uniref:F-box domain-containing protein n=1 Tax=Hohenbuehelia grisea TaxID=104357 RepID=A0ABR3J149_9AGAR
MPAFHLESLPVELIADILGELDLHSLIVVAYLSRRLRAIASDSALNPWRAPILRILRSARANANANPSAPALANLSVRTVVPRQNWIEILSLARPSYLLYEATLPNLRTADWEECFRRRFLPGWDKWKKNGSWKEVFLKCVGSMSLRR